MEQNKVAVIKENQNTITLGSNNAIVKMTESGAIRAVKATINLLESSGDLVSFQGKVFPTVSGYFKLNQVANVNFILPDKLELPDGHMVVNPYPIIDPESQTVRKIWIKEIGIGYTAIGNLQVISSTLLYDINVYFTETLMKKIKKNKAAGKICMEQSLTEDEKRTGIFFKIDGAMGIWGNLDSPEVLDAVSQFIQDKKFAERKAQSVIERNIIKKITGVSYLEPKGPDGRHVAQVPIVGWTHDLTREDMQRLADAAQKGEKINDLHGREVHFEESSGEISPEDIRATVEDDEKIIDQDPNDRPSESQEDVRSNLIILMESRDILGASEFDKVITKKFKKSADQLSEEEAAEALKLVNVEIDKRNSGEAVY